MTSQNLVNIKIAKSLFSRSVGVIGWKDFGDKNGLLLTNTSSIHTFFVRFPLEVVFLNKEMEIIKIVENLRPFSFSPIVWKAKHVLEMPTGSISKYALKNGDKINLT